ncbi:unannotated protein [freshwater metagenome]|uniref:Unannotated protein n=1 Tax=freshwater metagenome TaxID=449393 RepID=A0A6J7ISH9_9ZZZZ
MLTSRNRSAGMDVVAELTRIAAALAGDGEVSSAEIADVADRIAELRTSLTFTGLVDGL